MKNFLLLILICLIIACNQSSETANLKIAVPDKLAYQSTIDTPNHLVNLELFHYKNNQWKNIQTIDSIKSQFGNDSLEIMDFNFDNFMDFRIQTGTGGRGANLYYDVYVFAPNKNQYVRIENNIPNIQSDKDSKLIMGIRYFSHKTNFEYYNLKNNTLLIAKQIEVIDNGNWTNRKYSYYNDLGEVTSI